MKIADAGPSFYRNELALELARHRMAGMQRYRHGTVECRGGVADRNDSGEPLRPWRFAMACAKALFDISTADPWGDGILKPLSTTDGDWGAPDLAPWEESHQPPFGTR